MELSMLYLTDGNGVIIAKYTVEGHSCKTSNDGRIELTLKTDLGNISFRLCSDANSTAEKAMNGLIMSATTDISFSLFTERNYIFISRVLHIQGNKIEFELLDKITGQMI